MCKRKEDVMRVSFESWELGQRRSHVVGDGAGASGWLGFGFGLVRLLQWVLRW